LENNALGSIRLHTNHKSQAVYNLYWAIKTNVGTGITRLTE